MLRYLFALASAPLTGFLMADQAGAQTTSNAPAATPACQNLASQWDVIEKDLAYSAAVGQGDHASGAEASRSHHELANLTTANLLYAMLRDNKCALPKAPPTASTYKSAALACALEANASSRKTACDRKTWTRDTR